MQALANNAVFKAFVREAFDTDYARVIALHDSGQRRAAMYQLILKAGTWDPEKHPRSDRGQFVSKDAIQQAKSDPKKAKELKKRVTDPEQRKKLDAALADPEVIGTKRGLKQHETAQKHAEKTANRAKAREIRIRLIDQDSRGEELNPDDLRALIPHLSQMSHEELSHTRELLARQGASFGGKRLRADRVAALVAWATGKAEPQPQPQTDAKPDPGTAAAQPAPTGTSAAPEPAQPAPVKTRLQALAEKARANAPAGGDDVNTEYAKPRDQYHAFTRAVVPADGSKPDSAKVVDYLASLPDHARERLDQHFRAGGKSLREIEQFHQQAAGQLTPERVRAERAARADAGDAARAAMTGTGAGEKTEHPRDRLGRLRSMIPHAGIGGGFSPQKGDTVATIGDEVAAGKYSVVGASRDGTKFTIRPDRATLTDDQRKLLRSDPTKYDKTVSAFEVIPPSHGSIARRLAGIVGDADTNQAGANLVLDAAERDLAVTTNQSAPVPQVAPKPAPVPREVKTNFTPDQVATQAEAFKRHTTDAQAGLPGRRDVALAVMNQFRNTATAQELKDFARAVGVSDNGTRDQIGQRLVAYALDDPKRAAPTPTGTGAAPDPKHVAQMDKAEAQAEEKVRRDAQGERQSAKTPAGIVGQTVTPQQRAAATRAGALVSHWKHHTDKGNAAEADEAARRMIGHGAERLHAAGETVPFDGRTMESQAALRDGDPVRVTRHGWHMPGGVGEPLLRAQAEPVASGSGAATGIDTVPTAAQNAPTQQGGASVNQTSAGGGGSEPPKVPPVASGAGDGDAPLPRNKAARAAEVRNRIAAIFAHHRSSPESQDKAESSFNYGVYNALYGALGADPKKVDAIPDSFSVDKFAERLQGLVRTNNYRAWKYDKFKEGIPEAAQIAERGTAMLRRLGYDAPKRWTSEDRDNVSKWLAGMGLRLHGTVSDEPAVKMTNPARGNTVIKFIDDPTEEGVRKTVAAAKKELGIRDKATATRMRVENED